LIDFIESHPAEAWRTYCPNEQRGVGVVVRAIREMSDAELDRAAPVSLHADAPVTAQYLIEDHPLSHAYQHLASIRAAVNAHAA
jgi:hypothetical protein